MKKIFVCILTIVALLNFVLCGCTTQINNIKEDNDTILAGSDESRTSQMCFRLSSESKS